MVSVIIFTGTPATGKTTLAREIAEKLNYEYLEIKEYCKNKGIYSKLDDDGTIVIDTDVMTSHIKDYITHQPKSIIIDGHLSHFLSPDYVDFCFVTTCDINILNHRLVKRGYSESKIRENLDSEIFQICLNEANEIGHNPYVINTNSSIESTIESLILQISGKN